MYPALQELIRQAECQYLQSEGIDQFKTEIASLQERVEVYKTLRNEEIELFQNVADQLVKEYPQAKTSQIENCLSQWLLVSRYCAMAMIVNNPEFLERRLLEWLVDIVQVNNQSPELTQALFSSLMSELGKVLSPEQSKYIEPFLAQAHDSLNQVPALNN